MGDVSFKSTMMGVYTGYIQVLESLKKSLEAPAPMAFPQSAQYKKNFEKDEGEAAADGDGAKGPAKSKKRKNAKKKRKGPAQAQSASKAPKTNGVIAAATSTETYSAHRYSELREEFIDTLKAQGSLISLLQISGIARLWKSNCWPLWICQSWSADVLSQRIALRTHGPVKG